MKDEIKTGQGSVYQSFACDACHHALAHHTDEGYCAHGGCPCHINTSKTAAQLMHEIQEQALQYLGYADNKGQEVHYLGYADNGYPPPVVTEIKQQPQVRIRPERWGALQSHQFHDRMASTLFGLPIIVDPHLPEDVMVITDDPELRTLVLHWLASDFAPVVPVPSLPKPEVLQPVKKPVSSPIKKRGERKLALDKDI